MSALDGVALILWAVLIANVARTAARGGKPSRLLSAVTIAYTWVALAVGLFTGS